MGDNYSHLNRTPHGSEQKWESGARALWRGSPFWRLCGKRPSAVRDVLLLWVPPVCTYRTTLGIRGGKRRLLHSPSSWGAVSLSINPARSQHLRSSPVINVIEVEAKTFANWELFLLKYQCKQNKISTDPFKLLMETDERKPAWRNTWSFRLMEQRWYNEAVGPPGGHNERAMGN